MERRKNEAAIHSFEGPSRTIVASLGLLAHGPVTEAWRLRRFFFMIQPAISSMLSITEGSVPSV